MAGKTAKPTTPPLRDSPNVLAACGDFSFTRVFWRYFRTAAIASYN